MRIWWRSVAAIIRRNGRPLNPSPPRSAARHQTLLTWVRQHGRDTGQRDGPTTADQKRVRELEREVRELRKANEILKLASAFSPRRARPPIQVLRSFVDAHRDAFGVESICRQLQIARPTAGAMLPSSGLLNYARERNAMRH